MINKLFVSVFMIIGTVSLFGSVINPSLLLIAMMSFAMVWALKN